MLKKHVVYSVLLGLLMGLGHTSVYAEGSSKEKSTVSKKKGTYTEDEFLKVFSGKSRKAVEEKLGKPAKKEQSVKPTGANTMLAQIRSKEGENANENRVNVEMWYYDNVVNYDPKHTYKRTELTFVNDRCMNITFFNN